MCIFTYIYYSHHSLVIRDLRKLQGNTIWTADVAVYDPAPLTGNHLDLQISQQPRRDFSESNVTLSEKFTGLLDDDHHAATWQ